MANVVMVSPELMDQASELRAVIGSHLIPGFIPSSTMQDEQVFNTFYPHATIRINHYNAPVKVRFFLYPAKQTTNAFLCIEYRNF